MVKVKVRAGKEAVKQAQESGGDFGDPPQPGLYHLKIAHLEQRTTQNGPNKGGKYLSVRYQPVGTGREGAKIEKKVSGVFDTVSLTSEDSDWVRARFALALGQQPNKAGVVELEVEMDATKPGSPVGKVILGRVKAGKDLDGNYKPEIGWIGPLEGAGEEGEGFEEEDAMSEEDEEASSPFGEEEEAEDEEEAEEEEESGDYYTEESLAALSPKELGAAAGEFDLDTKDYLVKLTKGANKGKPDIKKTSAAIIAAILEAQGVEEEGEGDDDDNPF